MKGGGVMQLFSWWQDAVRKAVLLWNIKGTLFGLRSICLELTNC
jgi:hypothetical protein